MPWHAFHLEDAVDFRYDDLARRLGLGDDFAKAWGHVGLLWIWMQHYQPDGNIAGINDATLKAAAKWRGDAKLLRKALKGAGFTDAAGSIINWEQRLAMWRRFQRKTHRRIAAEDSLLDDNPASPARPDVPARPASPEIPATSAKGTNPDAAHIPTNPRTDGQKNPARVQPWLPGIPILSEIRGGSSQKKTDGFGDSLTQIQTWHEIHHMCGLAVDRGGEIVTAFCKKHGLKGKPPDGLLETIVAYCLTAKQNADNPIAYVMKSDHPPTKKELEAAVLFIAAERARLAGGGEKGREA